MAKQSTGAKQSFTKGMIVSLKSGGPNMTVDSYDHMNRVVCKWFSSTKLHTGIFDAETLDRVEDEEED